MKYYEYGDGMTTIQELSNKYGIKYTTLVERLKRGYTVEEAIAGERMPESVKQFVDNSYPPDWNGLLNEDLYKRYVEWCDKHDFERESQVHFSRCLKKLVPMKSVCKRIKQFDGVIYKRVVQVDMSQYK